MKLRQAARLAMISLLVLGLMLAVADCQEAAKTPADESPIMLAGDWVPQSTHQIDFANLPRVPSQHAVVVDVRADKTPRNTLDLKNGGMSQHNYVTHHDGKYWIMWSQGP